MEKKKNLMDLCWDTPTHTPYTTQWLHSVLAAEAKRDPTFSHAHLKKQKNLKIFWKNYLSWQDSTFRVSSTFKSYLLSVAFIESFFFKQASETQQSREYTCSCDGPLSSMLQFYF